MAPAVTTPPGGLTATAETPKSLTTAVPEAGGVVKLVPVNDRVALLPTSGGLGGITPVDGGTFAVTTTCTVVAAAVVDDPLVVVVVAEVLIVPKLQSAVNLSLDTVHALIPVVVPTPGVAEVIVELAP